MFKFSHHDKFRYSLFCKNSFGGVKKLVDKLINEFKLPYLKQAQTPTQLLNNYAKTIYNFEKIITPQNLGIEAHEQIMLWGVLKAQDHND